MGLDAFICIVLYLVIMITIQLDDQDDIIEFALMVQQLLHELGGCGCDEE
jgi:hypothetical protein